MSIHILAFGIAREILGSTNIEMPDQEDMSVNSIKSRLEQQFPRLKELKSFAIAVNGAYATPETTIKPGDELAIIPPVSGG